MKFVRPFLAILWLSGTIPYHTPVTTEYSASLGDLPDTPREQNDTLTNAGSANSSSSQSSGTEGQEVDNNIVSSQVSNVSLIEASNATEDKPLGDSSNQTVLQGQKARAIGHTIILDDGTKTPSDTANNNQSKAQKDAGNSQKSSPSSSPTGRSGETVTGSTPGMSMSPAADDAHTSDVSLGRSCPAGRFGEGCKEACGHCEGGNSRCHVINGVCMSGCESGWLGIRCKASCGPGTWGDHCYGCGRCLGGDVQCNRTTGHCGKGCLSGWHGPKCMSQCGHCLYGTGSCESSTGVCQGGCKAGWRGSTCHAPCAKKQWGENCAQLCGQCKEDSCNSTDGRCSRGCVAGWGDKFCTTPCNGNTYGPNCSRTCGHCRKVKDSPIAYVTCSRAMGNCSDGCDAGWYNERCDAPCSNGTFGPNCSQICPPCNDTPGCTCNPVTGECNYGLCPVQSLKNKRNTLKATLLAVSALLGIVTVAGAVTGTAVLFVHRARAAQRRDEDEDKSPAEYSTNSSVNAADFTPGGSTGTDYSPDSHNTEDGAP